MLRFFLTNRGAVSVIRCLWRTGIILVTAVGSPALAADPLRVAVLHSEPWGYYRDNRMNGIFPEINRLVALESGLELSTQIAPNARIWRDLKNGDIDLTYAIRSTDQDAHVRYVGHLFDLEVVAVARPGIRLKRSEDLRELRVGRLQGITFTPRLDQDVGSPPHDFRDYETMVEMLLAGRIDVVIGNRISLDHLLGKKQPLTRQWPRLVLQRCEVWAQLSRRSARQEDAGRIASAIEKLVRQGELTRLIAPYREPPRQTE